MEHGRRGVGRGLAAALALLGLLIQLAFAAQPRSAEANHAVLVICSSGDLAELDPASPTDDNGRWHEHCGWCGASADAAPPPRPLVASVIRPATNLKTRPPGLRTTRASWRHPPVRAPPVT